MCRCAGVRWREQWGIEEKKKEEKECYRDLNTAIVVVCQPSDSQTITAHYLTVLPADSLTNTLCARALVCMRQSHEFWFTSQSILYLRNKSHQAFIYSDRQTNGKGCGCVFVFGFSFSQVQVRFSFLFLSIIFLSIFFLLFLMDVDQTASQGQFLIWLLNCSNKPLIHHG